MHICTFERLNAKALSLPDRQRQPLLGRFIIVGMVKIDGFAKRRVDDRALTRIATYAHTYIRTYTFTYVRGEYVPHSLTPAHRRIGGTDVYGGQVYPSGARANQPPAAPPIQDYNLLEECPTQPGIHPGTDVGCRFGFNCDGSRSRAVDRRSQPPIATPT